ncbi:MAG: maleylpyruvate isomerase family mycothiol-dependent enzyme [Motilibacteraceae bacterium]
MADGRASSTGGTASSPGAADAAAAALTEARAAWESTLRATLTLARTFTTADFGRPTDLPGWSVKDVLSHLAGFERLSLGEEPLAVGDLSAEPPHVRNDLGRRAEVDVEFRRSRPGEDVVSELASVVDRRAAELSDPALHPDDPAVGPLGPTTLLDLVGLRTFDAWMHEQDLRRAVGQPGGLDSAAARVTRRRLAAAFPFVVGKRAGAQPGQSVALEVVGELCVSSLAVVGPDGRASLADAAEARSATATLRLGWADYVRRCGGRCAADDVEVWFGGDVDLGRRVLEALPVTP